MKQVTAIIKPFRLNEVRDALNAIGVSGLTVTSSSGLWTPKRSRRGLSRPGI